MARIVFPVRFADWIKLFKKVKAKDTADGPASIIKPFLTENGIVLADDSTDADNAVTADGDFSAAEKESEKQSKERDRLFKPVFKEHKMSVQFLKKFYAANIQKLGDWSVTVDNRGRIVYPVDFSGRQSAVLLFIAKHNSFPPGASPLITFLTENEIDLAANKTKADNALTAHDEFNAQDALKEQKRQLRDTTFANVEAHLRLIGGFLVKHFGKNPRKAGDWGLVIDDSPKGTKVRSITLKPGEAKVVTEVIIQSVMQNIGATTVDIYKGKTASGAATSVTPGSTFLIPKGYSNMTLKNTSNTAKGVVTVVVHK